MTTSPTTARKQWNAARERKFLAALATHANVTKALKTVRMSSTMRA